MRLIWTIILLLLALPALGSETPWDPMSLAQVSGSRTKMVNSLWGENPTMLKFD